MIGRILWTRANDSVSIARTKVSLNGIARLAGPDAGKTPSPCVGPTSSKKVTTVTVRARTVAVARIIVGARRVQGQ